MSSTTRVPAAEIPEADVAGLLLNGELLEPAGVMWNNRAVLTSMFTFGRETQTWNQLDQNLRSFAVMAVEALVGCAWCVDFQYFQEHNTGIDVAKASEVPRWRASTVFTPLERDVMEYAEEMSVTPPQVSDERSARLLEQLGAPALVELTAMVAAANMAARNYVALGIKCQDFSKELTPPLAQPSAG